MSQPATKLQARDIGRRSIVLVSIASLGVFAAASWDSYRGFFSNDDFDNLANARQSTLGYHFAAFLRSNLAGRTTFRPLGALYYFAMVRLAGLHFAPYIAAIQVIHLANAALVWLVARALGATRVGAAAAAILLALNFQVFQIYWLPMYVFDLLCATGCLISILLYARGRWILSLLAFWLAFKAKELAIAIPLILAAYEYWFGARRSLGELRWKRLAPFFAIAGVLIAQALLFNVKRDDDYSLRFAPAAIAKCAIFYASKLIPGTRGSQLLALALIALPFFVRDSRVRFGVFSFVALLALLLFLPGRLYAAYLYVPFIGLAIALSAATRPVWLVVSLAILIPWSYRHSLGDRTRELAEASDRRAWFQSAQQFIRAHPHTDSFVYDTLPKSLWNWGVNGMLDNLRGAAPATALYDSDPGAQELLKQPHLAQFIWDARTHRMIAMPRASDAPFIILTRFAPAWQLTGGWLGHDDAYRWMAPRATARLLRPANAAAFKITVWVPQIYLDEGHQGRLDVAIDHQKIGSAALGQPLPSTFQFAVPPAPEGAVEIEFEASPGFALPGSSERRGAAIIEFGFAP